MSIYLDRAKALRAITERHYNCAQSVVVPFADVLGIDEETLYRMAANFGGGMKMASVCGALTGALMALGLAGLDDVPMLQEIYRGMKARHNGHLECRDLLAENAALRPGGSKRQEVKRLLRELRKENPVVEQNVFGSVHNVQLDTFVGWKFKGIEHDFLESYDE